ncbi:cytochrome P450 family protein [Actinocrispum wychmicini]|uniref:Cytochrome P450 n=1 Tax=Actinocrispum wychmicini TaxID=1213861 RepID=A0A4R2J4U9_9PSEU|nr:cytochrome P450 [Actinocrispum wychmicini]TCO53773.1 cytochrome P450 [Actinocrispum wychmicini]
MAVGSIRVNRDFIAEPHAIYERLRAAGPVTHAQFSGGLEGWLVTRYADARALLTDPRLSKDRATALTMFPPGTENSYASPLTAHMLNTDPPVHTRLRKLVNKAFTARTVARLRPRIEKITDELLDDMSGVVDVMDALAFPLPIIVICELLGVPAADRTEFRGWAHRLFGDATPEQIAVASEAASAYVTSLIEDKRTNPGEDMVSDLIRVSDDGDRLSGTELRNMAFLLLAAGFETTANLVGNSVLALVRHPDQQAVLRADPTLLPNAVEEFLRFECPVHIATVRFTTEPVWVDGVQIPANSFVMISLLSANRDHDRFDDPYRLDVTRPLSPNLAFGYGIHHCLGAPLARLEGEIALGRLLARTTALTLDGDPETLRWQRSVLVHGLYRLPVRLT